MLRWWYGNLMVWIGGIFSSTRNVSGDRAHEKRCADVVRWQYGGVDGGNALKDKEVGQWWNKFVALRYILFY